MSCLPGGRKLMHDHVVAGAALCRDRCSRSLAVARQWGSFLSVAACETKPLFIINTRANTAPARAWRARATATGQRAGALGALCTLARVGVRAAWLAACAPWSCTSRPYDKRSIHTPALLCAIHPGYSYTLTHRSSAPQSAPRTRRHEARHATLSAPEVLLYTPRCAHSATEHTPMDHDA